MEETNDIEYEFNFSDVTILEGEGKYDEVKKLMEEDIGERNWMIESHATISSQNREANFMLHFWNTKDVYIMDYISTAEGVYYNTDLIALSSWLQNSGWNAPIANDDLVKRDIDFWKYFWETGVVSSNLLNKRFGVNGDKNAD